MAFNFGKIGEVASRYFDSDYIDIKRDLNGKLQEVYSNIPCHIAYASTDNPDPTTVDIKPIIQSITVHLQNWVDIRNNDFIIAKKVGADGAVAATYSGRCGNPVVSQGRKKVLMQMNGTEADTPTPIPPVDGAKIIVSFVSDGAEIQDLQVLEAEIGKPFDLAAPVIEGYEIAESWLDGELQQGESVHIDSVGEGGHEIRFIYSVASKPEFFRYLVNGLYAKDDGSFATGWHLYKKINIESLSFIDDVYMITCADQTLEHEDNYKTLKIEPDARMVLIPGNDFVRVSEITSRNGGNVTFKAVPFEPTEAERNAYVCGFYD